MEIFHYYISQGAKQEVEGAFLRQCCRDYFVEEKLIDPFVFRQLAMQYRRGEPVDRICKLALLKFYAENEREITQEILYVLHIFLRDMLQEKIHLNCFRSLERYINPLYEIRDKTIVEYRTRPGVKARIHYLIDDELDVQEEYCVTYMREICSGVFSMEWVLFYGERLQYYIVEEDGNREQLTHSGSVSLPDMDSVNGTNRYDMINDMVISQGLGDYETMDQLLLSYDRQKYLGEHLFGLK